MALDPCITAMSDPRLRGATAAPRIMLAPGLLDLLDRFKGMDARVERPEDGLIVGSLLKIRDSGQLRVWRLTGECDMGCCYTAEWPD